MIPAATQGSLPPNTPLSAVRAHVQHRLDDGVECPACHQFARRYRRTLNAGMARALVEFYRRCGTAMAHKPTVLKGFGSAARDESLLRFWGLLVEEPTLRPDGGRAGWWQVTDRGELFIREAIAVPKYAIVYAGSCHRLDGDLVTIRDCLRSNFNLDALMRGE